MGLHCIRFLILKSGFRQAEHYIQLTTLYGIISWIKCHICNWPKISYRITFAFCKTYQNHYILIWSLNIKYAAAAKSLQSCPILWDPIYSCPPGSPVPRILQARTLEWVAISFSNAWNWKVKVKSFSRFQLFTDPWSAAYQAPLSMGFSRQEYRSG